LCSWAEYNNYNSFLPSCCLRRSTSHSHGSRSRDRVFLTSYKWKQTHRGPHCTSLSNSEVHTEDILSARWVGLTNSKSTSLCQYTIPHSTKVDLFYYAREITIPNIVLDSCGMR
jgi:hypothetical protein